jgi:amino-acid N-acetyltransferase
MSDKNSPSNSHILWFRDASPYISAHRDKTFVIYLGGQGIEHHNFSNIIADIVLLQSLGIRLVLVHGAAPQIETALALQGKSSDFVDGIRVTHPDILSAVEFGVGQARSKLEAELCKAPRHHQELALASGNHIKARPLGIHQGVDFHNTGRVRKVNSSAIRKQLDTGALVVISPLGYSPSGEVFNINSLEVAAEVASALLADKLIILEGDLKDESGLLVNEIQVSDIDAKTLNHIDPLAIARHACLKGVERCHLLDPDLDGVVLNELFTRDGVGTQVVRKSYEEVRTARADDVGGIIDLIAPLEADGILVKRSRERLEAEIGKFIVIDRDGTIVGCAALYGYGDIAELACLVTHPDYRDGTRGDALLDAIRHRAREESFSRLFVLTTHTAHWFTERGFEETVLTDLPLERQNLYNYQRNSKLFATSV